MLVGNALQIFSPFIKFFMLKRDCINFMFDHQRMGFAFCSVEVEFFFQEMVNSRVEVERKSRRPRGAKPLVYVEASRALHKEIDAAAADRERLVRSWVKEVARFLGIIVFRHGCCIITTL